jgi:apolipoprotein N-acyltransferase
VRGVLRPSAQAALSGVLYGLAFPPTALRALAWVALVPLLLALREATPRRAAWLGAVWTVVATWVVGDCLPRAVVNYYHQPYAVGVLLLLGTTLLTAVPYYAGFAIAYAWIARARGAVSPLLAGALWVAAELGRVEGPIGDPWGIAGYSQAGVLRLAQIADLTGVYGLSFLVLAVNQSFAILWSSARARLPAPGRALRAVAPAAVLVVLALSYGAARLAAFDDRAEASEGVAAAAADALPGEGVLAAVIQPNVDVGTQWSASLYGRNLESYLRMTHEALQATGARLAFWPEAAMVFFVAREPGYRRSIARVLDRHGAELVAGGPRAGTGDDGGDLYFNSTFAIGPDGQVRGHYDKERLLPFAEYFPLGSSWLMRRDPGKVREFSPGAPTPPLSTAAGRAGIVVCNEAMFPDPAASRVAAGAELLVNPSNDSWPDDPKFSLQVFDIVRLRAIEQRRPLVRTSTSGPSAIVAPSGRVLAQTDPQSRGWISGRIAPTSGTTWYFRLGDAFAYACVLVSLGAVAAPLFTRRRSPAAPATHGRAGA